MVALNHEQIEMMRQRGLLHSFSEAECCALLQEATIYRFPQGHAIFAHQAPADEVGWILRGQAQLLIHGTQNITPALRFMPGDALGFISFLAKGTHLTTTQALVETDVLLLGRAQIEEASKRRDPLFSRLLMALAVGTFWRVSELERIIVPT